MERLEIRLLGAPALRLGDATIGRFVTRKAEALFVYLACTGRPHARDALAAFFWPDAGDANARNSLRHALSNLRALVGDYLTIDRQEVAFDRRRSYWLDVEEFSAVLAATAGGRSSLDLAARINNLEKVEAATRLYADEFLAGFSLPDAPAFDEWVLYEREHYRALALRGLSALADHYIDSGNVQAGLATTRRLLALEPWYEIGHQQQMLLLAHSGDTAAALRQYELCHKMLAEEFGVAPAPETTALYSRIKAGDLHPQLGEPQLEPTAADRTGLRDIPQTVTFVGRSSELELLRQRHLVDGCSVIALLGVGGVGKTALAAHYARACVEGAPGAGASVDRVLWSSLLNAPPLDTVLRLWLRSLSGQRLAALPDTLDEQLALLFDYVRRQRCLLVLDNLESVLLSGYEAGRFRPGYEGYDLLIRRMGELSHRSTLLLTSRDMPLAMAQLARSHGTAGNVTVGGLADADGIQLLVQSGLENDLPQLAELVRRYSGNPLALKLVADTVRDLFAGDLAAFLGKESPVFGDIRTVLDQQFSRLTDLEREILTWLAVERTPVTPDILWDDLASRPARSVFLEAMVALRHTSLVELIASSGREAARLTLQNVVMEYATDRLLRRLQAELVTGELDWFQRHALVKANAQEYVQESQRRLLLQPVADWICARYTRDGAIAHLLTVLAGLRRQRSGVTGYAAANVLHLLLVLQADVRGLDLSHLALRQADLRTAPLVDADLTGADLTGSVFASTIGAVESVAASPDGRYFAASSSDGAVYLWRASDFQVYAVLRRHTQLISSLQFSWDGRLLLSSGIDRLLCLWDIADATLVAMLDNDGVPVLAAALHPAGDVVATAGTDNVIRMWAWQDGVRRAVLRAPTVLTDLAYSPDGRMLVSVGQDSAVSIWRADDAAAVHFLRGHAGNVLAVACHPDGRRLATGGEDGAICLWDATAGRLERILGQHDDFVLALAFTRDGHTLASSSADQTARVWDLESGECRQVLTGHRGWVKAVAPVTDGHITLTGGYDQTVRAWETRTGRLEHILAGHLRWVDSVKFSPDGQLLAACSIDGPVRVWEAASKRLLHTLQGSRAATRHLAFDRANQLLAAASDDHKVRLWDLQSGQLLWTLSGHTGSVRNVFLAAEEHLLVSGGLDARICVWDVGTGKLQRVIPNIRAPIQMAVAFDTDLALIAYAAQGNSITLEELATGATLHNFPTGAVVPNVVALSPSRRFLVCGATDGALLIFDLCASAPAARPWQEIGGNGAAVWRIFFSPDSATLCWVCADQQLRLIDLATGQVGPLLPTHYGVFCVGFSADSRHLITDSTEHALLLRSPATGDVAQSLAGHTAAVTSIDVNAASGLVASSSADGTVRIWDIHAGECLAALTAPGPYAGMRITGVTGISPALRATLLTLGAIED